MVVIERLGCGNPTASALLHEHGAHPDPGTRLRGPPRGALRAWATDLEDGRRLPRYPLRDRHRRNLLELPAPLRLRDFPVLKSAVALPIRSISSRSERQVPAMRKWHPFFLMLLRRCHEPNGGRRQGLAPVARRPVGAGIMACSVSYPGLTRPVPVEGGSSAPPRGWRRSPWSALCPRC